MPCNNILNVYLRNAYISVSGCHMLYVNKGVYVQTKPKKKHTKTNKERAHAVKLYDNALKMRFMYSILF